MKSPDKKNTSIVQIALLIIVPTLLILLVLETFCRIVDIEDRVTKRQDKVFLDMPTWVARDIDQNNKKMIQKLARDPATVDWLNIFEPGDAFRVRMKPNINKTITNTFSRIRHPSEKRYTVQSNALGFRGEEIPREKGADTFRVLIFGDSSSFGWGVNGSETYSAVFESVLEREAPSLNVEVGNFAIPGDSSAYGRLIVEKYAQKYSPDLVILGFGANDAKRVYNPHQEQVERFRSSSTLHSLSYLFAEKSALYRAVKAIIIRITPQPELEQKKAKKSVAVTRDQFQENLDVMTEESYKSGSKEVLVLSLCTPGNYAYAAREFATDKGVTYLNGQKYLESLLSDITSHRTHPEMVKRMEELYPAALERNELFYITSDLCHPNRIGHQLIGERIAELIREIALPEGAGSVGSSH